ncbi:retrovirus-related Pol polyprotein from transposon TNT 1-94 [Nephila pilipes]|uniref:Retrovirus-related Pol polyprotein from transposon TNT 1-94 n=1 Tax=Nephila pilipes TaxID=299642 RepID=A0A8X6TI74_NEPPI|nr:retrovirus-related Pol polyprotein from transposon TNT 1-94 [Nephila pilipes]
MKSLYNNPTWDLVKLPKGNKPISCKWTFKRKLDQDGNTMQNKARLVARRYNQKFGNDYDKIFAPVVKHSTVRAFLIAAVYKKIHVKFIEIKIAFLHGDLQENIYMIQPEGYITPVKNRNSAN